MDSPSNARRILIVGSVAVAYFAAAEFGLSLAFVNASASAVWPATGLAIAAGLLLGAPGIVGVFVGAFFANFATNGTLAASLAIAGGNSLEALVATLLVTRYARGKRFLDDSYSIMAFVGLAGILATSLSATVGVASLIATGLAPTSAAGSIWFTWWLGDLAGAIVVTPFIVAWATSPKVEWTPSKWFEAIALLAVTLLLGATVFALIGPVFPVGAPISFILLPPVVWVAYRFSAREAATISVGYAVLAIIGTLQGGGPFARPNPNEALLLVQAFLFVATLIALPLAATVTKTKTTERELAASRDALEERVLDRTKKLAESERRFAEAQRVGRVGSFQWEASRDHVSLSEETTRILGINENGDPSTLQGFVNHFDEPSREGVALALRQTVATGAPFSFVGTIPDASGDKRVIEAKGGVAEGSTVVGTLQDVTERAAVEDEKQRGLVARKLVRKLLRELAAGNATISLRRDLGRSLAADADAADIHAALDAFYALGIGKLSTARAAGGKYVFEGEDLLEVTPGYAGHTCFIALGYLETTVGRAEGAVALGSETACQSQGHARCVFDVRLRR